MLKSIYITSLVFLFIAAISAQEKAAPDDVPNNVINATTYIFSTQTGVPLLDMSSGTTDLIAGGTDDGNSPVVPIGFLFRYDGVNFTTFGANGNGFIKLGMAVDHFSTSNNSTTTGINNPKIAPYWNDLCVGSGGKVHYKTIGLPGIRRTVVEWRGMNPLKRYQCDGTGTGTFQLWLFEGSGEIQFVYGDGMTGPGPNSQNGYSVLLHTDPAPSFASVTTSNNSVNYTTANNNNLTAISAGTSYTFAPRPVAGPVGGTVTEITVTSLRLNWSDFPATETGYIVRRTTDNVNYEVVGSLPANSTTFADSGLKPNTHYTYLVNAVNEGRFSDPLTLEADTLAGRAIVSESAGGLWSNPSTWVNGIVPTSGDDVTIANGSTVIIDTAAVALNVTVGTGEPLAINGKATGESLPAVLRFGETAGFSLTVVNDVKIGAGHTFATGGGNANAHVLTLKGDLINNGTLDFATNNNQAGALIVFQGSENSLFGGSGPVTDITWMRLEKVSKDDIVELSPDNFTVLGATDNPEFGFLIHNGGTLKISGTFTGSHLTFNSNPYDIGPDAGLWLNNPNYTILPQHQSEVHVHGNLRVSAGTYNIGKEIDDSMSLRQGSTIIIEGGSINTAGRFIEESDLSRPFYYFQTGGTVTTCTTGQTSTQHGCFEMGILGGSAQFAGGKIVIQNATGGGAYDYRYTNAARVYMDNATIQFGNEFSAHPGNFRSQGDMPNLVVYTGHNLVVSDQAAVRNIEVQPGATLETGSNFFGFHGESFVNNGTWRAPGNVSMGGNNVSYSGNGVTDGPVRGISLGVNYLTLNQVNNLRVRNVELGGAGVINSGKLTLGNNDSTISTVSWGVATGYPVRGFDSPPVFELGTGGQSVSYSDNTSTPGGSPLTTGYEINPDRTLVNFSYRGSSFALVDSALTLTGGDITVNGNLNLIEDVILAGNNKIIHKGAANRQNGHVEGTIVRPFTVTGPYTFHVGKNGYSPVTIDVTDLGATPPSLAVTAVDATLPALLPATSVSRYWKLEETGFMAGKLSFTYRDSDIRGNEADYRLARTEAGSTSFPPGCILFPDLNTFNTPENITFINGDWGIGAQLDPGPVSISGSVTTSGGQPIRNATLTLTGGGLPAPVQAQTGNFGTYIFTGLQAGETYTIRVDAKRYRFGQTTQQVTPMNNVGNVNFVANP